MKLEWHKSCLKNHERYHADIVEELERFTDRVNRDADQLKIYRAKIARAEAMGKGAFDSDRFSAGEMVEVEQGILAKVEK